MSISKRNSEGYNDPTTYEALTHLQHQERKKRYRKIVFVCSPLRGDIAGNTAKAREYCRFTLQQGYFPLAVHLLFPQFLDDNNRADRELAITMGLQLLSKCNALWIFGNSVSEGMKREIGEAKRLGVSVRQFDEECREVLCKASHLSSGGL